MARGKTAGSSRGNRASSDSVAHETVKADVLVIGSGGAGLRAAIELFDRGIDVLVVGKCGKREAHTTMATGGINAALGNMDAQDSWQLHAADTIRDGDYINDGKAVELLCRNAPRAVEELARFGVPFAREKKTGKILQRFFGAATYRRACFVGDKTGEAILNALVDQVIKRKIRFQSNVYVFALLHNRGKVNGALGLDVRRGRVIVFHAKKVLLATGGHSRMYKRSSSHFWENNGDGIYLANKLGAEFMDMELFQFHPTGMIWPEEADGLLVTESVRGEGGILTNALGERFMSRYDAKRMELSARDIVARAIYREVEAGRGTKRGGVWLDISHRPKAYILERLPKMFEQFKKYANVDISREKMEVAPTAHYAMGGLRVKQGSGETGIPNLHAVGEVTSGVHGGNRLGGNSLAEIVVFGRLTGEHLAKAARKAAFLPLDGGLVERETAALLALTRGKKGPNPLKVKRELQALMWRDVGVVRNEKQLKRALASLKKFSDCCFAVGASMKMNEKLVAALDVRNMLSTSEMIVLSALARKESRGAHFRSDYHANDKRWLKNVCCRARKNGKGFELFFRPVVHPSKAVQKLLDKKTVTSKALLE